MNFWIVCIGEPVPLKIGDRKMRAALVADELAKRGHNVLWFVSAFDHLKKKWVFEDDQEVRLSDGITARAIKGRGYERNVSVSRFLDHRMVAKRFRLKAPSLPAPDAVVVSMPPHDLAYEAASYADQRGIPLVIDIRDRWPDIFVDNAPWGLGWLARAALARDFRMLDRSICMASSVVAVTGTFLDWALSKAGRRKTSSDRVFYLGHKREGGNLESPRIMEILKKSGRGFVVSFLGTFATYHSPSIMVDCARLLADRDILFVLAGQGEEFEKVREKAAGLDNMVFPGFLGFEEGMTLLTHSDIGVCPTPREADIFPNKASAYLSAGLPLISCFGGDLRGLVETRDIGINCPPGDVRAISAAIMRLYDDRNLWEMMSSNARKVFEEILDSDRVYAEYADHIEEIASRGAGRL